MNINNKAKTYILRFIGYGVMPGVGMILGYLLNFVAGSFFFTLISPLFRLSDQIFTSRVFDIRVSVLEYVINMGLFVVFIVFLLRTIMQAKLLLPADFTISKLFVKKFFLLGLWAGLSISQFLFRIVLPIF